MKSWRIAVLITLVLLTLCAPRLWAADKLTLRVNGVALGTDVAPIIENGRALVPIRVISEALGFAVSWDPECRAVTIEDGQRRLAMVIDQTQATVDGQVMSLDVPARIIDGRTVVPLRFAGAALGADVAWDDTTRTVSANRSIPIVLSGIEQSATELSVTIRGPAPLRFDKQVEVNPSRLLLDLPFAKTDQEEQTIPVNKAGVISIRSSQREDQPTTARIAFDLEGKTVETVKVQPSADGRQITVSVPYRVTQVINRNGQTGEELSFTFDGPVQMIRSTAAGAQTGVINDSPINLRQGPGTTYTALTLLNKDTRVTVLGSQPGWVNIRLADQRTGWVAQQYITLDPPRPATMEPVSELAGTGQRLEILLQGVQPVLPSFSRLPQSQLAAVTLEPATGSAASARLIVTFTDSVRYKVTNANGQLVVLISSNKALLEVTADSKAAGTLLKVKLNEAVSYRVSRLQQPDRLLIEIAGVDQGDIPATIPIDDGLVKAIRVRSEGGGVVIVADLAYYVGHSIRSATVTNQIEINLLTAGLSGKLIVLDPGHGGSDPGAIGVTKFYEKIGTLDIALQLKTLLEKAGAKVLMTRSDDRYVDLSSRATMANDSQADLFLSIHHNSAVRADANGIEVLYSSGEDRQRLADSIQQELVAGLGLRSRGIVSRPEIYVIRETKMTSALAEIGFVSNASEETLLKDAAFRQKAAQALYNGLTRFFAKK